MLWAFVDFEPYKIYALDHRFENNWHFFYPKKEGPAWRPRPIKLPKVRHQNSCNLAHIDFEHVCRPHMETISREIFVSRSLCFQVQDVTCCDCRFKYIPHIPLKQLVLCWRLQLQRVHLQLVVGSPCSSHDKAPNFRAPSKFLRWSQGNTKASTTQCAYLTLPYLLAPFLCQYVNEAGHSHVQWHVVQPQSHFDFRHTSSEIQRVKSNILLTRRFVGSNVRIPCKFNVPLRRQKWQQGEYITPKIIVDTFVVLCYHFRQRFE